jgi:hypothetical protein
MTRVIQYRVFTEECARLAKEITNKRHRATLKKMEAAWRWLGEEAETGSAEKAEKRSEPSLCQSPWKW